MLLPDFTISKFEAELCVSSTDLCHLNWLFISWHSQAVVWGVFCLCQLVSAQYGVLTEHTLGSCLLGRWFFLLGKWIPAQTFYWFVYPASCTGAALEIHAFPHNASTAKTSLSLAVCVHLLFCFRLLWFFFKKHELKKYFHFIFSCISGIFMSWEFPFVFKWWIQRKVLTEYLSSKGW